MRTAADAMRSWPMLAALGTGIVLFALAAGAGGLAGIAPALCGAAALGWGVLALRAGRPLAPRATLGGSVAVIAASVAAIGSDVAAAAGIPVWPLLAADLLALVVAVGAAAELRRRRSPDARARGGRVGLLGMVAGAALVSALATPALAGTDAGEHAVPHGELHGDTGGHVGH